MKKRRMPPLIKIVLCFVIVILVGFLLLKLPFSVKDGQKLSWVDAFFTSTSAVCVTGLVPVADISATLSVFGKIVLMVLIQLGGLGFVTIAVFVMIMIGAKIGIGDRYLLKEALNQNSSKGMVKLVKKIILTTLIIEFLGFVINMFVFTKDYDFLPALGISAFHAVSSFNNSGFDILGSVSLMKYQDNILLNISTSLLIILGGLGFVVINDVLKNKRWRKLTIHSRIVLKMTAILIVSGTVLLKLAEGINNDNFTWLQAFFQSVTARTAGFATVNFATLNGITIIIMIGLMIVGASPGGTGGGIKTTTLYTMLKSIKSFSVGKKSIAYGREIGQSSKLKAFTLTTLAIFGIFVVSTLIMFIERNNQDVTLTKAVFETTSAFGTVGLSMGITQYLHPLSKLILCLLMFFGRLGPLTIFSVWNRHWNLSDTNKVEYIEEKIIIG